MKKHLPNPWGRLRSGIIACATAIFLVCPAGTAQPRAQQIETSLRTTSLESVIKTFETRYDCKFIYSDEDIRGVVIPAAISAASLEEALDEALKGTNLTYRIHEDNVVALRRKNSVPAQTPQAPREQQVLSGGVYSAKDGRPLIGASVVFEGTTAGAAVDANGQFQITVPVNPTNIIVSYIGYKSQTVKYNRAMLSSRLTITLEEDASFIDEIVVQGYGTTTVKDATGSISRLNAKEIEMSPMTSSVQSLLQGRAAGVNVQIQSASPTSPVNVLIRGVSTLTSNTQPLWVIDGVPDYSSNTSGDIANSLYNLNIADIESIDILKDASAMAIYGSRAANGVVLVTTKRGTMGAKQTFEASVKRGLQYIDSGDLRAMNASEYKKFITELGALDIMRTGSIASTLNPFFDATEFNKLNTSQWDMSDLKLRSDAFYGGNTDWWDLLTQVASSTQVDFSVRGGNVNSNHYLSFGYNDQEGIIKGGRSQLFSGRLNFETLIINDKVKLGLSASGSVRKTDDKDQMLNKLITLRPDQPAYNADGSINIVTTDTTVENPLLTLQNTNSGRNFAFVITPSLEWTIIEGLILRTRGTIDYLNSNTDVFNKKGTQGYSSSTNSRYLRNYQNTTYAWENSLDFTKTFDRHAITAMAVQSIEKYDSRYLMGYGNQFPDEEILINLGSGANSDADSDRQQNALASFIGRLNYKFDDRYLATVTFRADGSSKFGSDKRWGYFPSAALAWVISEEKFMQPIRNIVPYLKLRGSVGVSGSQNLGNHDYLSLYDSATYNGQAGVRPQTLGNNKLQWEETTSFDLGLDFGFLNERVRGTIGYYSREISNLIYNGAVPANSSFSNVNQNIGVISNKGWEFDIKVTAIKKQDMLFEVGLNIATNKGKVKKLDGIVTELYIPYYYQYVRLAEGSSVGDWYGYKWNGRLYQSAEELYGLKYINPTTGAVSDYRSANDYEGSLYLEDTNGDGRVTNADRVRLGNFNPKFFGGFNLTFNYKNLFASAIFSYSYGAKRLWNYQYSKVADGTGVKNHYTAVLDSYTFNRSHSATFPALSTAYNGMTYISDYFIHDASYIRLNTLNISYRLPKSWFLNTFVSTVEITATGTNLFTITKYPGFDPQGNFSTSDTSNGAGDVTTVGYGEDRSLYPAARMFGLGLKVTFK